VKDMYSLNPKGNIDGFIGDSIYGWCACGETDRIAIRIAGRELIHVEREIPRADVKVSLDLPSDKVGFETYIPRTLCDGGRRKVEILVISASQITIASASMVDFPVVSETKQESIAHDPKQLRRAAVVCWDLAHNPAGRALVLYEILQQEYEHVDLIGPMFSRFGTELWEPLRGLNLNIVSRQVDNFSDLLEFSKDAASKRYGMVWICKPRLPSILIGLQIAESSKCRVALDIDDYEMSFFKDKDSKQLTGKVIENLGAGKMHPADFEATALAHSFIENFKLRTVSNISLQRAFGGEIVPHGRLGKTFDPARFDKAAERKKLGLDLESTVLGFIGTVRKHKGISEIARAVGSLPRHDVRLFVAGTYENDAIKEEIQLLAKGKAVFGGPVPFEDLPSTLSACDLVCLPQDVSSETSVFQLPAKLVDGISLGLKVIVNDLPTYDDLNVHPSLIVRSPDESLEDVLEKAIAASVSSAEIRKQFDEHLSVESLAIRATSYFNTVRDGDSIDEIDYVFETIHQRALRSEVVDFIDCSPSIVSKDLVVLWKQADSGLFGRRVDMVAKYLQLRGGFDRVFVIDAPLTAWEFSQLEMRALSAGLTNARLLYDAFVQKFFRKEHSPGVYGKTFITSEHGEKRLGRTCSKRADLWREIRSYLHENKVSESAHLLIYPVAPHVKDVFAAWNFDKVVVDLVDDERDFATNASTRESKHEAYIETLCLADAVFTNNQNMKHRFSSLSTREIEVVANGVERFERRTSGALRLASHKDTKGVVGYVGNLRDRIDSDLLIRVADECEGAHLLLVGPTGGNKDIERLRFHPNITMAGARSYEESRLIAAGFDIGIIPHTMNSLTDSMNPLKFFLYRELGIPVVTTPVKNLGTSDELFFQSDGTVEDFVRLVGIALGTRRRSPAFWTKRSKDDLWSTRVDRMLKSWNN